MLVLFRRTLCLYSCSHYDLNFLVIANTLFSNVAPTKDVAGHIEDTGTSVHVPNTIVDVSHDDSNAIVRLKSSHTDASSEESKSSDPSPVSKLPWWKFF